MWNELLRRIRLLLDLTSARVTTSFRKLQIKHAYHPVRIVLPIIVTVILIVLLLGFTISFLVSRSNRVQAPDVITELIIEDTVEVDETPLDYVFAPFPAIEGHEAMDFLIVADKYDRVLHLLKNQRGTWGIIKSYPVAIGANDGPKQVKWDKRTPEGTYFIISHKEDAELNEIYGPLAYVLNYPNPEDRIAGRTGDGIWIHGTLRGKVPVDTRGCLEMHNNNIEKLEIYLQDGDLTPVVIHDSSSFNIERDIDLNDLWAQRERIIHERNPIVVVDSTVSDTLALTADTISVIDSVETTLAVVDTPEVVDEPIIEEVDTPSVNTFTLAESIDTVESVVPEVVVAEIVTPEPETTSSEPVVSAETADTATESPVEPVVADVDFTSEARAIIEKWRTDWQSMKIEQYETNYDHERFQSGDYDWDRWRVKKVRTFNNYNSISVEISGFEILSQTESRMVVKFLQKYKSDLFRAENGKQITLQKRNGNWKIVQELSVRY